MKNINYKFIVGILFVSLFLVRVDGVEAAGTVTQADCDAYGEGMTVNSAGDNCIANRSGRAASSSSTTATTTGGTEITVPAGAEIDNGQVTINGQTYTLSAGSLADILGSGLPGTPSFVGPPNVSAKCGLNYQDVGGICMPSTTGLSSAPIYLIISNIFSWLMGLFTTLAVIAFVISGTQYLMAAGNEDLAETAKGNAVNALIGIVVGLSGFIIIKAIAAALTGQGYFF